jgi:subtilisin
MQSVFSYKPFKVMMSLITLLALLLPLQFSSPQPAWAQGGDEDGGEAGYTQQPLGEPDASETGEVGDDPWLAVELAATEHLEIPGESDGQSPGSPAPTQTLNTGHFGHVDPASGTWVDDETVTTSSVTERLAQDEEFRQYYQQKLNAEDPTRLTFRSGVTLRPEPGIAAPVLERLAALQGADSGGTYYVIQFSYPFPAEARQRLEASGVLFFDHIGPTGLYARIPAGAVGVLQDLIAEGLVRHVGEIPAAAKIDPGILPGAAAAAGEERDLILLTFEAPTPAQLEELGRLLTIERRSEGPVHILEGKASAAAIQALAEIDYVKWLEKQPLNDVVNLDGSMGIGGDVVRASGGAYDGTGVHVMVVDSGIARSGSTYHPDLLASRILDQYDYQNTDSSADDQNSHGTHVAGTIGGKYNSGNVHSERSAQGMAPDVDFLIYKLCCGTNQFSSSWFQLALQRGTSGGRTTHISSNSWGATSVFGTYNTNSEIADRAVRGEYNGQHINMVIASGNDDNLTAAPGTGKNVITVGSVKDGNYPDVDFTSDCGGDKDWPPGEQVCYSNHGPIDTDGNGDTRVKPDVVAPGAMIYSAAPWYLYSDNRYYQFKHGTSMATPHVSGAIAQILDSYSSSSPWLWSWPETVKALLMATTMDVGGNTNLYGRGLVDPYHAIYNQSGVSTVNFWGSSVSSGTPKTFNFTVPSGYREVRVVLTWSDPAGATEVSNDLDIQSVKDPGGTTRGSSTSYDDSVEYVKIPAGYSSGTWSVTVNPWSLSSSPQAFGLAVHRILADSNVSINPSVQYIPASSSWVRAGDYFYLHQYLPNSGFAAGGTYARLYVPSGFTVNGVRIYTADGHSHWYTASDIYHPSGDAYWRVAVGEVVAGYTRHVRWYIRANPSIGGGTYSFFSNPYWREGGSLQTSAQKTSLVHVPRFLYLPLILRGS